jgi:hypothetical protein
MMSENGEKGDFIELKRREEKRRNILLKAEQCRHGESLAP